LNKERLGKVLIAVGLQNEVEELQFRKNTLMEESGTNLSGGQRARMNLARCIYQEADIYLIDDPFSALDSKVSNDLFRNCMVDFLHTKTRFIVTHDVRFALMADYVILMEKVIGF